MRRKSWLILALLIPCLLLSTCGQAPAETPTPTMQQSAAPVPTPSLTEAPEAETPISWEAALSAAAEFKAAHAAEFIGADYLLWGRDALFAEYDGSSEHMQLKVGRNRDWGYAADAPVITDSVYYWHDVAGTAEPGRAASVLLCDLLEDLKSRTGEYSFTLTDYRVPEIQTALRASQALLEEDVSRLWQEGMSRARFDDEVTRLLPKQMDDGDYSFRAETLALPLVEDMWVLIPAFSYAYDGVCELRQFSDIPAAELTGDGLLPYQYGYYPLYYILLKHGDVWQMQNNRLIRPRCGGGGAQSIDLSGLDICRVEVKLGSGTYKAFTNQDAIARIVACLDGKSITWERAYQAHGGSSWVKFYTSDAPDARYAYKVVIFAFDGISIDDRESEHGYTFAPEEVSALEQTLEALCVGA